MTGRTQETPYSVSSLTAELKGTLESGFSRIYVEAEISGWRRYPSGHAYFTLKDADAQIAAVMFAGQFARCKARESLKDGAKVLVYGTVSVYAPRGNYQLIVNAARPVGAGDLMQRYLELKKRLEDEGLFDASRKRSLPFLPRRIGIVTSPSGAVIHDMCRVLTRRFPALEIRLFPSLVQGAEAPRSLIAGIEYFNASGDWTPDLIIVARGGGSFEDLYCFNDETLVRTLAASRIPTISAIGHESDYTLCDFAADVRAGTPSIAAELAVPVKGELENRLQTLAMRLAGGLRGRGEFFAQCVDQLAGSLASALTIAHAHAVRRVSAMLPRLGPALEMRLQREAARLEKLLPRLGPALELRLQRESARLATVSAKLEAYSPYGVLERGYSLTTAADGSIVRDASALAAGDVITTRLARGTVTSRVER